MAQRQKIPAADVLFSSSARPGAEQGPAAVKHVKVTVYMPPEMVAELDEKRAELRRDGVTVDRGRLVRSAIRMAQDDASRWRSFSTEEEN